MPPWVWAIPIAWYLTLNAASAALLVWDKRAARRARRRVPERTLLWLIWLGGFVGGLVAMRLARHKTRKWSFRLAWIGALAVHGAAWMLLAPRLAGRPADPPRVTQT